MFYYTESLNRLIAMRVQVNEPDLHGLPVLLQTVPRANKINLLTHDRSLKLGFNFSRISGGS